MTRHLTGAWISKLLIITPMEQLIRFFIRKKTLLNRSLQDADILLMGMQETQYQEQVHCL